MGRVYGPTEDDWTAGHDPGANTQATATKAAVAGKRNVCTGITVMITADDNAPTAKTVSVRLINGASGGTWRAPAPGSSKSSAGFRGRWRRP